MGAKADLLTAVAETNRGITATAADRDRIAALATAVEAANPTPHPLAAPALLGGNWRLLYTTSQELLSLDRFPLLRLQDIYQCIRPEQGEIYNIAEIAGPLVAGLVTVAARFTPTTPQRVTVQFQRGILGLQPFLGYRQPSSFIQKLQATQRLSLLQGIDFAINRQNNPGWLEVTYLDADLRIGRGNQGSLFVLSRSAD